MQDSMNKIGVLLINLGTPKAPTAKDVRRYLRQFLSDPRVIDINPVGRWLLVNLIVAPFRSPKSAAAYRKIWTERGSPLLFHTQDLGRAVAERLGEDYAVEIGMRYGEPSIESALRRLFDRGVREVRILPLYPQYSSSATGSTQEEVFRVAKRMWNITPLQFLLPFFDHPGFIRAFAEVGRGRLRDFRADHVLFSFHGLPERQILKGDVGGNHCLKKPDCCDKVVPANGLCYRAHSYATARALVAELQLPAEQYTVCFQSRLGRTPWIKPYTDLVIPELAKAGKKRLAVFCPAFVADCLETLEEVGMRARKQFRALGGEDLLLIPSLNAEPAWVEAVCAMVKGD
ncbi:MAG: ferrochelatase [Deltaproteobacteria bacterium]|nr:ferrochelatase [Deltaproteobacteria bacterium]